MQQRLGEFAGKGATQRLPVITGPAQPEAANGLLVEPARRQVVAGTCPRWRPQLRLVKIGCGGEGLQERLLALRPLAILRGLLGHRDPGLAGQPLDRLDKVEIVGAHQKADRIAMRAAAEAMEEPLVLDNVKRRCLLVVERAQPGLLAAAPGQPDPAPDQIAKRHPAAQLVEKPRREGHYRPGPRASRPLLAAGSAVVRPSRRPRRGLLRMTYFLNAI